MAPVPLNIAPAFRPWRQAGITYLLLDDEVRERLLARPEPAVEPVPTQPIPPRPDPMRPDRRQPPARPAGSPPPRPEYRQTPPPPRPAGTRAQEPVQEAAPRPVRPLRDDALPPEQWPAYWKTLLKKTPSSPSLVWTYPSLSRDLGGDADAAHRDFLRRLLGDMALPKGSHAFWPLNRYPYGEGESEQSVDARLFLSGVSVLNPESVILMCGQAPPELGLDGLSPLLPSIVGGRRFVVTPHVDDLIGQPQRYAQLITFLKALIAGR